MTKGLNLTLQKIREKITPFLKFNISKISRLKNQSCPNLSWQGASQRAADFARSRDITEHKSMTNLNTNRVLFRQCNKVSPISWENVLFNRRWTKQPFPLLTYLFPILKNNLAGSKPWWAPVIMVLLEPIWPNLKNYGIKWLFSSKIKERLTMRTINILKRFTFCRFLNKLLRINEIEVKVFLLF